MTALRKRAAKLITSAITGFSRLRSDGKSRLMPDARDKRTPAPKALQLQAQGCRAAATLGSARVSVLLLCNALLIVGLGLSSNEDTAPAPPMQVFHHAPPAPIEAYWSALPEARPPLRGFRAPIRDHAATLWPFHVPDAQSPAHVQRAARIVADRLAADGLLLTLARVVEAIGPANLNRGEEQDAALLRRAGLPVDLLAFFPIPGAGTAEQYPIVRFVQQLLSSGRSPDDLAAALSNLTFEFRKSSPTFRAASESGEFDIGLIRLQLPRGDYWRGIGDGSGLDVCRQLIETLPDARFLVSIQATHLNMLLGIAGQWPLNQPEARLRRHARRLTIIAEKLPVAEWAQDNGKAGVITSASDDKQRPATLVPRYANRGEEGTVFVPGENLLLEGLASAGHAIIQSPLLFQGGNLILATDPDTGWRYLLIGEAEIHRNRALGLTEEQTLQAFEAEFDTDICLVLPAVSYHIDYEVSLRTRKGGLTAFVNDSNAAVKIVLRLGTQALQNAGVLDETVAASVQDKIAGGDLSGSVGLIRPILDRRAIRPGQYPESLTARFSTGLVDSGVGNFQRFLLAMDLAVAEKYAGQTSIDAKASEYFGVLHRRAEDRAALWKRLENLRFKIVPIPSLAEGDRGVNYLNGIHERGRYLMPAYGGLFSELDAAASDAFRLELGNEVEVLPVYCAESQRRYGALRCAAAAYPLIIASE